MLVRKVKAGNFSFFRINAVCNPDNTLLFKLAPRVAEQLVDRRLGSLLGKLDANALNKLVENPQAQILYDINTHHINIIQNIENKFIRITTTRDAYKIISVGPVREKDVMNQIKRGRFIPVGAQLQEAANLDVYMSRIKR